MGGSTSLGESVDLRCVFGFISERARLEVAVLARRSGSSWIRNERVRTARRLARPAGVRLGAGSGPFYLGIEDRMLYIYGEPKLQLDTDNVLMFDEPEQPDGAFLLVNAIRLPSDFGEFPTLGIRHHTPRVGELIETLRIRLEANPDVRKFLDA